MRSDARGSFISTGAHEAMSDINLAAMVGTKEAILEETARRLAYNAAVNTQLVANTAVAVVKDQAIAYLKNMITPTIEMARLELVLSIGEPDASWPFYRREEWAASMDDKLEGVIEPYAHVLSSDWTARYTIDSKLHEAGGTDNWVDEFANEVYRNITYLHKRGEEGAPKTPAQVLSSVGIVAADIDGFVTSRPTPSQQQVEEYKTMTLQETIAKLHQWNSMTGQDANTVMSLLDNALDSDDGLAMSGMSQLGGDMADVISLRASIHTGLATVQQVAAQIISGPTQQAAPPQPAFDPGPQRQDVDMDLSQFMGGAPPAVPVMAAPQVQYPVPGIVPAPGTAPAQPTAAPQTAADAGPPPVKGKKGTPPVGALTPRVFAILKDHSGINSVDLGAQLGVSRGTFDNYAKGKAHCVPSTEHLNYLRNMIGEKIALLTEAYNLLPK